MRSYDFTDKFDVQNAQELGAEGWMLDILALNPNYPHWGPNEDCMVVKSGGWNAPVFIESWDKFDWHLDDYNECVHFYFSIHRDSNNCEVCEQTGLNPPTKKLADDYYDFNNNGKRWNDKITQDELDALIKEERLPDDAILAEVNAANAPGRQNATNWRYRHDAINRHILVKARAERLGCYGLCPRCNGKGYYYTAPTPHMALVLWMIHPRKGASRGVEIQLLEKEDVQKACTWLAEAAKRNAERFSKVVEAATIEVEALKNILEV